MCYIREQGASRKQPSHQLTTCLLEPLGDLCEDSDRELIAPKWGFCVHLKGMAFTICLILSPIGQVSTVF